MKKFNIHHLPITANKEKINVLYLELKSEKNILYTIDNDNIENIDLNLFKKMEFSENIQILPKKKSNELNLTIDHSNNLYSILINKKPLYTLKNNNSIILNNNICKLILSNGILYSNKINNLVIESKKDNLIKKYDNDDNDDNNDNDYNNDIVNSILKKDVKSLPSSSTIQISSKKELTIFVEKKEEPESSNILDKNVSNTEDDHNDLLQLEGSTFNDSKIIIENKIDNSTDVIIKKHYNIIKIDEDKSLELGNTNAQMIHTISSDDSSIDSNKFKQELSENKEDSQKTILLESTVEDSNILDIKLENLSEEKSNILDNSINTIISECIKIDEIMEISIEPSCEIIKEIISPLSDIKSNISKDSIKLEEIEEVTIQISDKQLNKTHDVLNTEKNIVEIPSEKIINSLKSDIVKEQNIQDKIIEVKKDQIDNEIFNLENILKDFNKLFKFMENKDNTISNNLSLQETDEIKSSIESYNSREGVSDKKIVQNNSNELDGITTSFVAPETKEKMILINKLLNIQSSRIIKVYYQNIMYKINVYKLEHTNDLNYSNLFKTKISKNNIINNSNISFELKTENSSYLISFFNEKYLINKINNTIVLTNLSNKKSQIIKNNDNFKIGNNDYILYNEATIIISATNKQIFDNNYGTSYNLYIPK